jgi:hypothetical protein
LLERERWLATCMSRMKMTMAESDLHAMIEGLVATSAG